MSALEPSPAQLATLLEAAGDNTEPVVMINLLRFSPDGATSYQRYAKEVQPYLDSVGATVLYAGDASHVVVGDLDRAWWDAIVVVRYPSRAAFLAMVSDPGYRENAQVHRVAALEATQLIATEPWPLSR